ncbi:outer membrane protein assembly factor BamE [Ornithobacterium rhinotracheale]|uniref:outer membrane protein assembly factor BamE domain-containing protein n=1 Tax=Ornithobacterium rhinotracheale TaxID=28251 RepID=UPI001FF5DBED|nr:outer membrane protein assembly factor BamE [Ornithobacterium rhinotracheale]MCK0202450.1 outer membrane protein assembly factor BamE [Ornithobacterium rhinotracheale]
MKKVILGLSVFGLFISCGKDEKVEKGMTSQQVKEILGEPEDKTELANSAIWYYKDVMVSLENDTVKNVLSKDDMKKAMGK